MKKIFFSLFIGLFVILGLVYATAYYATFSNGSRSGELIKFSNKGIVMKTWEGEISQGISGAQIFKFSVEPSEKEIIEKLESLQGRYVKVRYKERFFKLSWLGDTKYFITEVKEEPSPHSRLRHNPRQEAQEEEE